MSSEAERARLVEDNLPYVRALAAQIKEKLPPEIEYEELVGYGTQGLLEAAQRFDPQAGATFTTYAYYRIRGAIYDGLRHMGWLPRGQYARHRAAGRLGAYLESAADRDTAARQSGGAVPELEAEILALSDTLAGAATVFVASLASVAERRLGSDAPGADEMMGDAETVEIMKAAMAALPEKERRLLELHYFGDKSLQDAGKELGLSKSWASRLHARAIDLLRAQIEKAELPRRAGARSNKPAPG